MNVLPRDVIFFPMPAALVDDGHLLNLSASALRLYLVLLRLAQRHSAVEIELPDYKLRDLTGMDDKSAGKARRELDDAGLVACSKGVHGVSRYLLLHPKTGSPLPRPPGRRGLHLHRPDGRSARSARLACRQQAVLPEAAPLYPPSWDEIGAATPSREAGETADSVQAGSRSAPEVVTAPIGKFSGARPEDLLSATGSFPQATPVTHREQEVYFGA